MSIATVAAAVGHLMFFCCYICFTTHWPNFSGDVWGLMIMANICFLMEGPHLD